MYKGKNASLVIMFFISSNLVTLGLTLISNNATLWSNLDV
jgi:hypothetical protein